MSAAVINLNDYRRERRTVPLEPRRETAPITAAEAIELSLDRPEVLNSWEEEFLLSLRGFRRLSVKQHAVLQRIFTKVSRAAEEWAQ